MNIESWFTLLAIVVGPLSAVIVTYYLQKRDQLKANKFHIFRILMANRKTPVNIDRMKALNLIEIDFVGNKSVLDAHRRLIQIYDDPIFQNAEGAELERLIVSSQDAYANLVHEIAKSLGYNIPQLEALRGGYYPQAFEALEQQQFIIRDFIVRLNNGEASIPVRADVKMKTNERE